MHYVYIPYLAPYPNRCEKVEVHRRLMQVSLLFLPGLEPPAGHETPVLALEFVFRGHN